MTKQPQITVLDAGGQYCHLIARRVRELGVYAEVQPSEIAAEKLEDRRGIIISGGPASVYESGSPQVDPEIFSLGIPVLGICYGMQLMAHHLEGGAVIKGVRGEYGMAQLNVTQQDRLFEGFQSVSQVWMSHRDRVGQAPEDFEVTAATATCPIAAIANDWRKLYGIQFHPEVVHTHGGKIILGNFLFTIAGCAQDWSPTHQLEQLEDEIRSTARGRNVFFFASGGVDSTVAFSLCLRALGKDRVHAAYVDTGLMREGETEFVREVFTKMAGDSFEVVDAKQEFLEKLTGLVEPEAKRKAIGEEFVAVQERVLETGPFLNGKWILGQGTIYPDTIESGGTAKAEVIKTHHNRVAGIQALIDAGRLIEPLAQFYKDEVRQVGAAIGVSDELLDRHPFPGPGLAIRCLCSAEVKAARQVDAGYILPVLSVGVQGDARTYRATLALENYSEAAFHTATESINQLADVNRVVALVQTAAPLASFTSQVAAIDATRLERLRRCDAIVRRLSVESGFEEKVWQFPVVLLPCGILGKPDSIVLRPIDSVDGMTAQAVPMPEALLKQMCEELMAVNGVCAVFYDLTNKPPATIEWE
ncbi:glutamine-hydrolyzing GMP synthase [Bryobacter aggregatus]|uniref:glutamine-hydrolyzing GMP synthase n=1 Tax=Bryobacter aggregatus TaxID=360054 RepID=UPI0004E10C70|nr:glutamine-hydrolyzing GMP synthase [Bryobacter aggregatus]